MRNSILNFEHFLIYLSGAIQFSPDGRSWRKYVAGKFVNMGIPKNRIIDPMNKPMNSFTGDDLDVSLEHLNTLKKQSNWREIERISKNTIRVDLRLIDNASLVYAEVDPSIYSFGTPDEIGMARLQRKPVIAVVPGGIVNAPYWLIGRIGSGHIFASHDEALDYIKSIMHGKIPFDPKSWLFFDYDQREE